MDLAVQLLARGLSAFTVAAVGPSGHEELVAQLAACDAGVTAVDLRDSKPGTIVISSEERSALLVSLLPTVQCGLTASVADQRQPC